jgi:DNA-binding NarL/FixJ family response regulator
MIHAEPTTRNIPVIFLTAKDDIESVTKVLALKPAGYLLKTMKPMEIVSSIDSFFEKLKSEVH